MYCGKAPSRERVYRCTVCGTDCLHADRAAHAHDKPDLAHLQSHPTLKPLSLLRHLVRLICPRDGLILDPFAGTSTTCVAAAMEGRDAVGIEKDARYAVHGRMRLDAVA